MSRSARNGSSRPDRWHRLGDGGGHDDYVDGIPQGSRAAKPHEFLKREDVTEEKLAKIRSLNKIAQVRGQTMAQLALAWILRQEVITSALVGASRVDQIEDSVSTLGNLEFTEHELGAIEGILAK